VREADLKLMTRAGPEIGVASTKAFTTQLLALALLALSWPNSNGLDPQALRDRFAPSCSICRARSKTR
jgi:glucosamine--fructose-6-phosphate aminotransferase (isomerizing)